MIVVATSGYEALASNANDQEANLGLTMPALPMRQLGRWQAGHPCLDITTP